MGEHDLACHAKVGRTARTDPMYGEPGHAYVYFVYGMHHCLNTVCGPGGAPNAVLLRAAAPLEDDVLRALGLPVELAEPLLHSATGPGNLCRALGVSLLENRIDLCDPASDLYIAAGATRVAGFGRASGGRGAADKIVGMPSISCGPRIGVDYAGEWAGAPLRFWETESRHVSKTKGKANRGSQEKVGALANRGSPENVRAPAKPRAAKKPGQPR